MGEQGRLNSGGKFKLAQISELILLRRLWNELYEEQRLRGMLLEVPPDGFEKWRCTFNPALGRFAVVATAEVDGELAGFVAGRTRLIPSYFGGGNAGFISEVFVTANFRRRGLARRMLDAVAVWFLAQGVSRLELQVIAGNPEARAFYEKLGWTTELTQMVLVRP